LVREQQDIPRKEVQKLAKRTARRRLDRKTKISIKRTDWILGIPYSAKTQRGLAAEEQGLYGLKYHKKKKTEFLGGRVIVEITPTIHFSQDDRDGKDAFVRFQVKFQPDSEILPIQFQNWWSREAEAEFRKKRICLIAIWPNEDKNKARERTFNAISKFLRAEKEVESIL